MKSRRNVSNPLLFAAATMVSALFLASSASAKDDSREPALRAAEKARFEANVNADAKALGTLLDDNLEYTHSNGALDSKASFIESLTTGKRDYVATTFDIQSVRIFGDVGIIRGTAKVTVADQGKPLDLDLGYTDIWLWKDGRWQMTAWRSARMPPPAAK
jgi:hypothetical protein